MTKEFVVASTTVVTDDTLDGVKALACTADGTPVLLQAAPIIARALADVETDIIPAVEQAGVQAASAAQAAAITAAAALVNALRVEVTDTLLAVFNSAPTSGNATLQVVDGILQWVMEGAPTLDTAATSSGTPTVGQTLTGVPAAFTGDTSVANVWLYSDLTSTGVTTTTYALDAGDLGKSFIFQSTGINASGSTISRAAAIGPVVEASVSEFGVNGLATGITATTETVDGLQPAPNPLASGSVYEGSYEMIRAAGGGFKVKTLGEFCYASIDAGPPTDVIHEITFTGVTDSLFADVSFCGMGNRNFPYSPQVTGQGYTIRLYRVSTESAWNALFQRNPGSEGEPVNLMAEVVGAFSSGTSDFVVTVTATATHVTATVAADGGSPETYTAADATYRGNQVLTLTKCDAGTPALITMVYGAAGSTEPELADVDTVLWTEALDSTDTALANRNYILPKHKSAYDGYPTLRAGYTAGMAFVPLARFDNESAGVDKYVSGESRIGSAVWPVELRAGVTPPVLRHTGTKALYTYIDAAAQGFQNHDSSKAELHDRKLLIAQGMAEEQTLWFGWSEYWTHIDTGVGTATMQWRNLVTADVNTQGSNWLGELGINVATEAAARGITPAQLAFYIQGTGPCVSMHMNPAGGRGYMSLEVRSGECWTYKPIQWSVNKIWTRPQPTDLNTWYDIVVRFKSSQGATGRLAIWVRKVVDGVQESPMVASAPDFEHLGPTEYKYPTVQGIPIRIYPEVRKGLYRFRRQAAQGGTNFPLNTSDQNRYMAKYDGPWRKWIGDSDAGLALVNPNNAP